MPDLALNASAAVTALGPEWLDPQTLLTGLGDVAFWVVLGIIFAECGLLIGFFLPGDSLLFAVGMFIAQKEGIRLFGLGEVGTLIAAITILLIAAVLGNVVGYWVGMRLSPWLFKPRPGLVGRIFSAKHLADAHAFFERYGSKALVLGRFVPFVRTFVTMVAGAAGMTFRHFITWTGIGAVIWAVGVTLLGYFLGNVSLIKDNLDTALILIVAISVLPMVFEIVKERRRAAREAVRD